MRAALVACLALLLSSPALAAPVAGNPDSRTSIQVGWAGESGDLDLTGAAAGRVGLQSASPFAEVIHPITANASFVGRWAFVASDGDGRLSEDDDGPRRFGSRYRGTRFQLSVKFYLP